MVFSALLFLVLAVNGLFAADSDRVAEDGNQSEEPIDARRLRTSRHDNSVVPTNPTTVQESEDRYNKNSFRRLEDPDIDSYVNDDSPDKDLLLYAVYDYDDGFNDKNVHVIDPRSLADSPIIDASEDLIRRINDAAF